MAGQPPDTEAFGFVLDRLGSYGELHVLTTIAQEQRSPGWTVEELAARHPTIDVPVTVRQLLDAGLIATHTEGLLALAAESRVRSFLVQYQADPLPIIRTLTERSLERLRSAAVRTFADAFVVKRRKE
jgi:hypothetical protein